MTLTTIPFDPILDLAPYVGQRIERFVYQWINGVTNEKLGFITPEKGSPPNLSHNTSGSIKRRLSLTLGVTDTEKINPITDRILPFMIVNGVTYPLGRYMFTTESDSVSTRGDRGSFTLLDEGFIIDQQLETAFSFDGAVENAIPQLLKNLTFITINLEPSPYASVGTWNPGQTRGQIFDTYATQGDYFPYWMSNTGTLRMIRTVEPGAAIPDLDFDAGNKVKRDSISLTSDVLNAPNKFIVTSNAGQAQASALSATYEVPPSAPHSIANRGFVIADVFNLQAATQSQVEAAARNRGIRNTVYERMSLDTALDPRHDSYNIIRFRGDNWLELSWTMDLVAGGTMSHTMRKAYV